MFKKFLLFILVCSFNGAFALDSKDCDLEVKVHGMTCEGCANILNKKFSALEKVEEVKASFSTRNILIKLKKDKKFTDAEVEEVVKKAGYEVISINRNKS